MSFASNRLPVAARRAIACLAAFASAATWADGGLDASFNGGFAFADWVSTASRPMHLVVNASGRVVVTTTVRESGGNNYMFAAARFRTDGTLDPAFGYLGLRTLEFDLVDEGFDLLHGARALPGGALMLLGTAEVPGNAYAPAM